MQLWGGQRHRGVLDRKVWGPLNRDRLWNHVGVDNGQPGVWVDRVAMDYGEECLLVPDERFDLGQRDLKLVDKLRTLLRDESYVRGRENFDVCAKELVVRLNGK